jgi:putative hydrolase of the HAD superfamily
MFGYVPPVARRPIAWAHTGPHRPSSAEATVGKRRPVSPAARLPRSRRNARLEVAAGAATPARRTRRGLIIDLDDTLYPRERFVRSGLAAVARYVSVHHGIGAERAYREMARASADGRAGSELQVLCDRFGLSRDIIPVLVQVFRTHTPSLFLGRDSVEALQRLRADGWALAVLTNGMPSVQFRKVAALGVTSLVDEVIYAEEHAPGGKPAAAPFMAALRSLELAASQCVCVGDDAARDVRGARAIGMATIRLARPGVAVDAAADADAVIHSMRQVPEVADLLLAGVDAHVA